MKNLNASSEVELMETFTFTEPPAGVSAQRFFGSGINGNEVAVFAFTTTPLNASSEVELMETLFLS